MVRVVEGAEPGARRSRRVRLADVLSVYRGASINDCDVVIRPDEYGVMETGRDLVDALTVPTVVVLHTGAEPPTAGPPAHRAERVAGSPTPW